MPVGSYTAARGHAGLLAPILLVTVRLLQGFSAAGEQAAANSMSLEHAPPHRRAYYTSLTLSGTRPARSLLTRGWRVPFWASAVVVLVGYLIRRKLEETPVFEEAKNAVAKLPVAVLFRDHWAAVLRVIFAAPIASVSTISPSTP